MSKIPRRQREPKPVVVTQEKLFTPRQLARYLECSVDTVRRRILEGSLPAYKIGGTYRSYRSEIDAAIKGMKVKAP